MKRIFTLLVLLLISCAVYAATIDVQDNIPAEVNWSFSISLNNTDSFDRTSILIDSSEILNVYPTGQVSSSAGSLVLNAFTFDTNPASPSGLVLYVSYPGLDVGNHILKVETHSGGSVEEVSAEVRFYDIITEINVGSLKNELADLKGKTEELEFKLTNMEVDDRVFLQMLEQRQEEINSLSEKVDQFSSRFESIEQQLSSSIASLQDISNTIEGLKNSIIAEFELIDSVANGEVEEGETEQPAVAPLIALGDIYVGAIVIGVIMLIILTVLVIKKRLGSSASVYSKGKEEGELVESKEEEQQPEAEQELVPEKPGKWAYKEE